MELFLVDGTYELYRHYDEGAPSLCLPMLETQGGEVDF